MLQMYPPRLFQIFLQQFDARPKQYITKRGRAANARPRILFIINCFRLQSAPVPDYVGRI